MNLWMNFEVETCWKGNIRGVTAYRHFGRQCGAGQCHSYQVAGQISQKSLSLWVRSTFVWGCFTELFMFFFFFFFVFNIFSQACHNVLFHVLFLFFPDFGLVQNLDDHLRWNFCSEDSDLRKLKHSSLLPKVGRSGLMFFFLHRKLELKIGEFLYFCPQIESPFHGSQENAVNHKSIRQTSRHGCRTYINYNIMIEIHKYIKLYHDIMISHKIYHNHNYNIYQLYLCQT